MEPKNGQQCRHLDATGYPKRTKWDPKARPKGAKWRPGGTPARSRSQKRRSGAGDTGPKGFTLVSQNWKKYVYWGYLFNVFPKSYFHRFVIFSKILKTFWDSKHPPKKDQKSTQNALETDTKI